MARPVSEKTFANMLRVAIKEAHEEGKDRLRVVADKLVEKAMQGDIQAIKEIADRLDGKPAQQINHADETGEGPARFIVTGVPRAGD